MVTTPRKVACEWLSQGHRRARTPEEAAVSILAEVIGARTGRSGASLNQTSVPSISTPMK